MGKKKRKKDIIKIIIKSTVNQTCLVSRRTFNKRINTQLNTGISANSVLAHCHVEDGCGRVRHA